MVRQDGYCVSKQVSKLQMSRAHQCAVAPSRRMIGIVLHLLCAHRLRAAGQVNRAQQRRPPLAVNKKIPHQCLVAARNRMAVPLRDLFALPAPPNQLCIYRNAVCNNQDGMQGVYVRSRAVGSLVGADLMGLSATAAKVRLAWSCTMATLGSLPSWFIMSSRGSMCLAGWPWASTKPNTYASTCNPRLKPFKHSP